MDLPLDAMEDIYKEHWLNYKWKVLFPMLGILSFQGKEGLQIDVKCVAAPSE